MARRPPARPLVLGLLQDRPMHGDELMQVISRGTLDRWTSVLPGSIHHALARMQTEGELVGTGTGLDAPA